MFSPPAVNELHAGLMAMMNGDWITPGEDTQIEQVWYLSHQRRVSAISGKREWRICPQAQRWESQSGREPDYQVESLVASGTIWRLRVVDV